MLRSALISVILFPVAAGLAIAQTNVSVNASMPHSPRSLEPQTQHAAVQDYLQSWKAMDLAFQHNNADLLAPDFVGNAMKQLSKTVKEQSALGIQTRYRDISHDIRFLFYSPEGMSIQFTDQVKFNVKVFDHGRLVSSKDESARYLVVMTPSEVRWSVRVFQAAHI